MARTVVEYRCLLISPSDVSDERDAVTAVVENWNAQVGSVLGARIHLVKWETHAIPDASAPAQIVLNRQIVDECDFAIAIFWARLGTPTATHPSGSLEEIARLREKGSRVLAYFSTAPVPQEFLADDQYTKLQQFKMALQNDGFFAVFNGEAHLREQVLLHLTGVTTQLLERDRGQPSPSESKQAVLTAPRPDVRVLVHQVAVMPADRLDAYLRVTVQNHSPVTVFVSNISLEASNGVMWWPPRDALTGVHQSRVPLRSGESHSMLLDGYALLKDLAEAQALYAVVTDDIGREYRSAEGALQRALEKFRHERAG